MDGSKRMAELLVETGAYKDLDQPVILTSGELGIYYVNTEKLVQDNGEFEKYGDSAKQMYEHALRMMDQHPTFKEAIEIIAQKVAEKIKTDGLKQPFISGGQRRDWLFSGPVAEILGCSCLHLYKQEKDLERVDLISSGSGILDYQGYLNGVNIIHIADLLTEGSSVYNVKDEKEIGWVPMIRQRGSNIKDLFTVVTRNQGGEQRLAEQGIATHSFVSIDEAFLKEHSKNPDRAVAYIKNPRQWCEDYLKENGALRFNYDLDPLSPKFERAKKFLARYGEFLEKVGKMDELKFSFNAGYPDYAHLYYEVFGGKK